MDGVLEAIVGSNPLYYLVIAVLLLIIDVLVTQSVILLAFASVFAANAVILFFGPSVTGWLLCQPVIFLGAYLSQLQLFKVMRPTTLPAEQIDLRIGATGQLVIVEDADPAQAFYYRYKQHIDVETPHQPKAMPLFRVQIDGGELLPCRTAGPSMRAGERVKIIAIKNGIATVERT